MSQPKINLNEFANGALAERVNIAMNEVYANIADQNTDPTKKRKVVITMVLSADEERDLAMVDIEVKTTLTPARTVGSKIIIDKNAAGQVVGQELKSGSPGQMMISQDGEIVSDVGIPIDVVEQAKYEVPEVEMVQDGNVIDFRATSPSAAQR